MAPALRAASHGQGSREGTGARRQELLLLLGTKMVTVLAPRGACAQVIYLKAELEGFLNKEDMECERTREARATGILDLSLGG